MTEENLPMENRLARAKRNLAHEKKVRLTLENHIMNKNRKICDLLKNQGGKTPYVYIRSEPQLWTVGFYRPDGKWTSESDHETKEDAAARVRYLQGNGQLPSPQAVHGFIERLSYAFREYDEGIGGIRGRNTSRCRTGIVGTRLYSRITEQRKTMTETEEDRSARESLADIAKTVQEIASEEYDMNQEKAYTEEGIPRFIDCFDNGGETADRYTIIFRNVPEDDHRDYVRLVTMSANPSHPQACACAT